MSAIDWLFWWTGAFIWCAIGGSATLVILVGCIGHIAIRRDKARDERERNR